MIWSKKDAGEKEFYGAVGVAAAVDAASALADMGVISTKRPPDVVTKYCGAGRVIYRQLNRVRHRRWLLKQKA